MVWNIRNHRRRHDSSAFRHASGRKFISFSLKEKADTGVNQGDNLAKILQTVRFLYKFANTVRIERMGTIMRRATRLTAICATFIIGLLINSECGGGSKTLRMPWETGDRAIDSLLDLSDAIEIADVYDGERLRLTLESIDSAASRKAGDGVLAAAAAFARSRLQEFASGPHDTQATDSAALALLPRDKASYLRARLLLHMAVGETDPERKTDILFGILPAFLDARDSIHVVETLYELNMAYGRVWDAPTQIEYLNEIIRYVPDSLPALKAIMHSNIIRLERNRADTASYLVSLDSLRLERRLMRLAPPLGIMVYSDLYRLRGNEKDLDTAGHYVGRLLIEHDAERVYHIQRLARAIMSAQPDSAAVHADILARRMSDNDDGIDMESMRALIPYYEFTGDKENADSMRRRLASAQRSADAYERALKMARMNADRRIAEFRDYSESSNSRRHFRAVAITVGIVLLTVLGPAAWLIIRLRRRHRQEDSVLKNDLENTKRRLTVAQMRTAEKERAISSVLEELDSNAEKNNEESIDTDALKRKLRLQLTGDDQWERFSAIFTEMRPGFVDNLKREFPQLTKGDIRLCCLLDMGLETKHIAQLLMIRPESVKKHRQRLRAKFGITPDVHWETFLANF